MAKLIVIDWGSRDIRLLEAERRGGRLAIRKLSTVALPAEGDEPVAGATPMGAVLAQAASASARVVALVGRTQTVLRDLRVPVCPPEELTGMVRFQAMRTLSLSVEQASLDYDVLEMRDGDTQRRVILAALQGDALDRIQATTQSAHLELARLGLRPYATWRAYREHAPGGAGAVLIVNHASDSLELTVGSAASLLFSRATLLPNAEPGAESAETRHALIAEVRRTLAAFSSQMPGVAVTRIALPAGPGEHEELSRALGTELSMAVDLFDPFDSVELEPAPGEAPPPRGPWSGAIGAALAANEPWPIDFLNPKKAPVRRDRRKPIAVVAGAGLALVLATSYFVAHQKIARGSAEIQRLTERQNKLKETLKTAAEVLSEHQATDDWVRAGTAPLEDLQRLSEQFPDTREMHATVLTITRDSIDRADHLVLQGVSRQQLPIAEFQTKLNSDDNYSAQPVGSITGVRGGEYRFEFKSDITAKTAADAADDEATKTPARAERSDARSTRKGPARPEGSTR